MSIHEDAKDDESMMRSHILKARASAIIRSLVNSSTLTTKATLSVDVKGKRKGIIIS